jgi:hypothetical protein
MDKGGIEYLTQLINRLLVSMIYPVMNENGYYTHNTLSGKDSFYNPVSPGGYSEAGIYLYSIEYFPVSETFSHFPGVSILHCKNKKSTRINILFAFCN